MPTRSLEKLNVLVADDQAAVRGLIGKMLQEMQIGSVFEASTGEEALQLLESTPDKIGMIICDWTMPNMSGIELFRQVRATKGGIPFIVISSRADRATVIAARDAGVTAFLVKPFSSTQLEAKVRSAFARGAETR